MSAKTAIFYLLDQAPNALDAQQDELKLCAQTTITLCQRLYQQGLKVFVLAADKEQALLLDELLWQLPIEQFVPHQVAGEMPDASATIEIGWRGTSPTGYRHTLINLSQDAANFAPAFAQVIDFVPCADLLKQKARERYKIYKTAGRQIATLPIHDIAN